MENNQFKLFKSMYIDSQPNANKYINDLIDQCPYKLPKEEFYDYGVPQAQENQTKRIEESILNNLPEGKIQIVDDSLHLSKIHNKRKAKQKKE